MATAKKSVSQRDQEKPRLNEAEAEEIIMEASPLLQAFIVNQLGWQAAEDVLQDSLVSIARGVEKSKATSKTEFLRWCYQIARNKIADFLREKYRERAKPMEPQAIAEYIEAGSDGQMSASDRADLAHLLEILRHSQFPCDEVLWSHLVLGMDIGEIAAIYNVSYDAARMKINRCLKAAEALVVERK